MFCRSGNPFASASTLYQYAVPALLRAAGRCEEGWLLPRTTCTLTTGFSKPSKGTRFLRARALGGLVEIPCQKRNGSAAAVALTCAQLALAGVPNLVPFDETVAAMDAVGRTLPATLRETALGGIAAAPSACAWCAQGCGE